MHTMKYMLVFFVFYCCLLGCNEPIKTTDITYELPKDLSKKDTCDVFLHEKCVVCCDSTCLDTPKRLDSLCKEIKHFEAKEELIGENDSLIYNIKVYKETCLATIQKMRRNKYIEGLNEFFRTYTGYSISFNPVDIYLLHFDNDFKDFEYIIQNRKIVSPKNNCFTGRTVFYILYQHRFFSAKPNPNKYTKVDIPETSFGCTMLPNETYIVSGRGVIWINGKLNVKNYPKDSIQFGSHQNWFPFSNRGF